MNRVAIIGAVLLVALVRSASAQDAAVEVTTSAASKGALVLGVQSTSDDSVKRIAVDVQSNGAAKRVSGTADVIGFPFIEGVSSSDIDWKVDGSNVTGSITGKDGQVVGTFEGTITATGMSGKFTHVDGRVGLWSWDGSTEGGE